MYFCVVLCIVCFVSFSVLFVCICVLHDCHQVATQLRLNLSYRIISILSVKSEHAQVYCRLKKCEDDGRAKK